MVCFLIHLFPRLITLLLFKLTGNESKERLILKNDLNNGGAIQLRIIKFCRILVNFLLWQRTENNDEIKN